MCVYYRLTTNSLQWMWSFRHILSADRRAYRTLQLSLCVCLCMWFAELFVVVPLQDFVEQHGDAVVSTLALQQGGAGFQVGIFLCGVCTLSL